MNDPVPPLVFTDVALAGRRPASLTLTVPAHHTVAILADEASGIGSLSGYALGLERPAGGSVRVFGTVIAGLPERERLAFRRRVGYLPAGDGLLQNLSLRDNVALPLRFGSPAPPPEIEGRVNVMLAQVRVAGAAGRRPAQASEEERRRAAFARAMAFDPALLLLDQPFDGVTTRAAAELLELARGGETMEGGRRTILITGHELPDAIRRRVETVYRLTREGIFEGERV